MIKADGVETRSLIANAVRGACLPPVLDEDGELIVTCDYEFYLHSEDDQVTATRVEALLFLELALRYGAELMHEERKALYAVQENWPKGRIIRLLQYARIPGAERAAKTAAEAERFAREAAEEERRRLLDTVERSSDAMFWRPREVLGSGHFADVERPMFKESFEPGGRVRSPGREWRIVHERATRFRDIDRRYDRRLRQRRRECVTCE